MADWLSYSPADFIMLSEAVYWRLFAQANAGAPLPPALLTAAVAAALIFAPPAWRLPILGAVWAGVGWRFLWELAGPVNAIAASAAFAFAAQAVALMALGYRFRPRMLTGVAPGALIVFGLALSPFIPLATGRPLDQAEYFAIAPDPLAIGTLGFALAIGGWRGAALAVIPAGWLAASAVTLDVFGAPERWIPMSALAVAGIEIVRRVISARR